MFARILITALIVGIPAWILLHYLFVHLERRDRAKRRDKFMAWCRIVPSMPDTERVPAMKLLLEVTREGTKSEYRGPWETYEPPKNSS